MKKSIANFLMAMVVLPQGVFHAFWHPPNPGPILGEVSPEFPTDPPDEAGSVPDGSLLLGSWDVDYSIYLGSWFLDGKLGPFAGIAVFRGEPYRKPDKKSPGLYLGQPRSATMAAKTTESEQERIIGSLREIVNSDYFSDRIVGFVRKYEDVLGDSTRDEFYGRVDINGKRFALGGWLGKLTAVGVFDDYDSYHDVKGFLAGAREYFLLPPISADNVKVATSDDDFFYSFLDRDRGFMLRGYRIFLNSPDRQQPSIRANVIEYIKYYDPEFVP